jgi:Protein of unknown function DUF262
MNINPDYQRDVVWSEARMIHLMDSFFNNYYVPPLIFKVVTGRKEGTNQMRKWRTCIDGKQRLTTIRRFFDGEIPYVDRKKRKWYYTDAFLSDAAKNKKNVQLLPEEVRVFIEKVDIVNIEFEGLDDEQEEDMFQRVQLGVPLTVAEKLSALTGAIPSFINDLRRTYTEIPQLVDTRRSNDFKLMTILILLMHARVEQEEDLKLKTTQNALKSFLVSKHEAKILTPGFRAQARLVFSKYSELIKSHPEAFTHCFGHTTAKMRKFSPVEFLGVGIMIDVHPDRPIPVLAEDVNDFRRHLRDRLHDLRTNSMTWTHVMNYINRLEDARGRFVAQPESNKRQRTKNAAPIYAPQKSPAFNPPPLEFRVQSGPMSVYNEQQQSVLGRGTLQQQQQQQRDAFQKVPPARIPSGMPRGTAGTPGAPSMGPTWTTTQYAATRERHGDARKRPHESIFLKREN